MTDTPIDRLKPCPFCGGEAGTLPGLRRVYCRSGTCDADMRGETLDISIARWNTRATIEPIPSAGEGERAKALEEAAKVAEGRIANADDWDSSYWDQACSNIASAIRALATLPSEPLRDD